MLWQAWRLRLTHIGFNVKLTDVPFRYFHSYCAEDACMEKLFFPLQLKPFYNHAVKLIRHDMTFGASDNELDTNLSLAASDAEELSGSVTDPTLLPLSASHTAPDSEQGVHFGNLWGGRLGLAVYICKVLQPGCPCLTGQSAFLLKLAILLVHLTNIVQAPLSLGLSIYLDARYQLTGQHPGHRCPFGSFCAWCILLTPLGLTPRWVLMLSRSTSLHDVIVLQHSTSDVFNAVWGKYRKGTYSVTIVTSVPWDMEWVLHFWPCYELQSSVASSNKSEMRQRSCIAIGSRAAHWAIG